MPGVYRPRTDSWLLIETMVGSALTRRARVLDIGTGTGVIAMEAARAGAADVTAVDVSWRAVLNARLNARLSALPIRVRRGDVAEHTAVGAFDVVLANPPYVPSESAGPPQRGRVRAWEAGHDGRAILDPLCRTGPRLLAPGGTLLMTHSALNGVDRTLEQLRESGLEASVVTEQKEDFGPIMRERTGLLESRGIICPGQRYEQLVVIRGDRPSAGT